MTDRQMLRLWLRYRGYVRDTWSAYAAPEAGPELRRLLVDAAVRNGGRVQEIADWALEVEAAGRPRFTFVMTAAEWERR